MPYLFDDLVEMMMDDLKNDRARDWFLDSAQVKKYFGIDEFTLIRTLTPNACCTEINNRYFWTITQYNLKKLGVNLD